MVLGQLTGKALIRGGVVALLGPLGSGKTLFAKGVARGVGIDPSLVVSPTFILQNRLMGRNPFNHFDAYRLASPEEFLDIGADDFLQEEGALNLIEWAEKVEKYLPGDLLRVCFSHRGEKERELTFQGTGEKYCAVFQRLWRELKRRR